MNNSKTIQTITEQASLKREFHQWMGMLHVIPDSTVKNGFKRTEGKYRILISPANYDLMKTCPANGIFIALAVLKEERSFYE